MSNVLINNEANKKITNYERIRAPAPRPSKFQNLVNPDSEKEKEIF
jgi:hypothetical protein